jgi:hypothetical protein
MNKLTVMRVLFVLVITVAALSLLQVSVNAAEKKGGVTYEQLAACEGLECNDILDCGTYCFCNNPTDKVGKCYKDEASIQAFLEAQRAENPGSN